MTVFRRNEITAAEATRGADDQAGIVGTSPGGGDPAGSPARRTPAPSPPLSCSVIVPARNERGNIESVVRRVPDMGRHTEIIFVEGHSLDGTMEELRRVAAAYPDRDIQVLTQEGEGKADAVRKGFEHAAGDVIMVLDADLTVRPEDLPLFYEAVATGTAGLAIGSRMVYRRQKGSMPLLNLAGNKFFSLAISALLKQRITDTLCGTKALLKRDYESISRHRSRFGSRDPFGDFDLIFGADREGLRIVEVPIRYQARVYGETQIKKFSHGLLLLRSLCGAIATRARRRVGRTGAAR